MTTKIIFGSTRIPNRYFIDDVEVSKEEYDAACENKFDDLAQSGDMLVAQGPATWPMPFSAIAGVHPKQIAAAMEADRLLGVRTEYNAKGEMRFLDPGSRHKWIKAHGMRDNNGGYRS